MTDLTPTYIYHVQWIA